MAHCVGGVDRAEGVGLAAGKAFLGDVRGGGEDGRYIVGAGDGNREGGGAGAALGVGDGVGEGVGGGCTGGEAVEGAGEVGLGGLEGGSGAGEVASTVLRNANAEPDVGSLAGVWSTGLLFFGATAVFARLQGTLNLVFHTSGDKVRGGLSAWLRKRVFSFGVVLALGFLLLVSAALTTALEIAFAGSPTLPVLGNLTSLALYALAFALMYHYLPDRRVRWQQAFLGGVLTALLFVVGRWGIGLYIAQAAPGSAYGSAGTLVVVLVWLYYAAVVFFVGAMITAVIDERWRLGDVRRRLEERAARRQAGVHAP